MSGLLYQMQRAQQAQQRGLLSHAPSNRPTMGQVGRGMADGLQNFGLLASPIPVLGDAVGLLGDAAMYAAKPEERTMGNAALTALGVLPFFPALAGKLGRAGKMLDVTDAGTFKAVKAAMGGDKIPEGEIRQAVAQYNATLPKQAGGLGLPAGNTAPQRADAAGFDVDGFHGTPANVAEFSPAFYAKNDHGSIGQGVYLDPSKDSSYSNMMGALMGNPSGFNVMPVKARSGSVFDAADLPAINSAERSKEVTQGLKDRGIDSVMSAVGGVPNELVVFDPARLRSRFAAFDPAQRESRNLLASMAGVGLLSPAVIAALYGQEPQQ
jgi:hypothetical protein